MGSTSDKNWTLCSQANSTVLITVIKAVRVLLNSCWIHLSRDLQAVESLHVTDGIGQDLSRSHSGHLPTRLREVSIQPEPGLSKVKQREILHHNDHPDQVSQTLIA